MRQDHAEGNEGTQDVRVDARGRHVEGQGGSHRVVEDGKKSQNGTETEEGQTQILGVPSHLIDDVWKHIEPMVESGLKKTKGEFLPEDIRAAIGLADAQLWLAMVNGPLAGIVITEIRVTPRRKIAVIWVVAGDRFDEWGKPAFEAIQEWAAAQDCDGIEALARHGWTRHAKSFGFAKAYTVFHQDLGDG